MSGFFSFIKSLFIQCAYFLPGWFNLVLLSLIGILLIICIIKIVAFILDAIPFL